MYKVLIADDERFIRQGLQTIIDWNSLGFEIIGEAANGKEVLDFIQVTPPDLLMIDIRMPKLHGLDAVKEARALGFTGKVIVLSGYAEFGYAKEAIELGIVSYLTKPVDTDALLQTLSKAKEQLDKEKEELSKNTILISKAKETILYELLTGDAILSEIDEEALSLTSDMYQVINYEKYSNDADVFSYNFSDLLRVANPNGSSFEEVDVDGTNALILKGSHIIEKFNSILAKYNAELPPEHNSPLDTIFITCGKPVSRIDELYDSYLDANELLNHRFFCDQHQHIMDYHDLPDIDLESDSDMITNIKTTYIEELINHIQAYNRNKIAKALHDLQTTLYNSNLTVTDEKNLLVDLYLGIKEKIHFLYSTSEIPFIGNSAAINRILNSYYLFEIITFLSEQFEMIMTSIGYSSRDSIIDDIVHYIDHNYSQNITLENIAPLFGYNSSYLGKIFSKKMGINFNTYLDNIRIEHSKELLLKNKIQVYKVAELVGYRNVDYFHIKFKKSTGLSPAEFRKQQTSN